MAVDWEFSSYMNSSSGIGSYGAIGVGLYGNDSIEQPTSLDFFY